MSNQRVATRYASALMALTREQKKSGTIADDLLVVKEALDASRELRMMLASPVVPTEKKQSVLKEVFKKKISETVQGFLFEIAEKGRENMLPEILHHYFVMRDVEQGIVRVQVKTSVEFSAKQEKELAKHLESMTKKKVEITFSLDTALKGGFIARVGDTVLDGSVRRQLEIMRTKLTNGSYNN